MGFPEWTAQFPLWKTNRKDSSEACATACQNYTVYRVFPSGMKSHIKIAQFNWECIAPFTEKYVPHSTWRQNRRILCKFSISCEGSQTAAICIAKVFIKLPKFAVFANINTTPLYILWPCRIHKFHGKLEGVRFWIACRNNDCNFYKRPINWFYEEENNEGLLASSVFVLLGDCPPPQRGWEI